MFQHVIILPFGVRVYFGLQRYKLYMNIPTPVAKKKLQFTEI